MDYRMLIDRFFQGVTTPEEEQELRRCLLSDDMPAEIRAEKELLLAMLEPAEYDCSEAMAEVSAMVDSLATQEPASVPGKRTFRVVMLRYLTPAVAAAAVLLFMFRIAPGDTGKGFMPADEPVVRSGAVHESSSDEIVRLIVEEPQEESDVIPLPVACKERSARNDESLLSIVVIEEPSEEICLSEPELRIDNTRCGQMAYVGNQDTYTAPEEVARHIDDLFSMFAAATADGLNEQKEHLRQFAVLNEMFK